MFHHCLAALERCEPPPDEIIIVADGDGDRSWLPAQQRGYRTIVLDQRSGPANARNIGAEAAESDILLFIDADVLVPQDIISRVSAMMAAQGGLSAIIGSYDDSPTAQDTVSQYRNLLHHFTHQHAREDASTFWGACGAIRRSAFRSIGGFNPRYTQPSIEDIELGYRLKEAGHAILLAKDLQVTHQKKWRFANMLKTDIFQRAIPWAELLLERGRTQLDLNLTLPARLSTVVVFSIALLPILSAIWPSSSAAALPGLCLLLGLNFNFYRFLTRKQGLGFTLKTLPLHWLYFLYSGLAYLSVFFRIRSSRMIRNCCFRSKSLST
jgi:glycosyltransferase involved in cell wall biosynthesis